MPAARRFANDPDAAWQTRPVWPPEPGFFALRLRRGGWEVPAAIHCANGTWSAIIDGVACAPCNDPVHAPDIARVWHHARRIDAAEYDYLIALKAWAAQQQPAHPCLHPHRPINPALLTPLPADALRRSR